MTVQINFRWGHLDRMPKCEHGRVEGYCRCWDEKPPRDLNEERMDAYQFGKVP